MDPETFGGKDEKFELAHCQSIRIGRDAHFLFGDQLFEVQFFKQNYFLRRIQTNF